MSRSGGWLTRNLKVISGVSFLQDVAYGLLYPVLPIFLTGTLGAPAAVVGLVEGVAEGAASVIKVAAGRLSDRYQRRPLIGLGYGLTALGKVLIAVAGAWRWSSSRGMWTGSAKGCVPLPGLRCSPPRSPGRHGERQLGFTAA